MVVFVRTRVDIHDHSVQAFIRAGGEVNNLIFDINQDTANYGKSFVAKGHVRSGRLLKGIQPLRPHMTGVWEATGRTTSKARHTIFFHDGTTAIITGHPHLVVPRNRGVAHTSTRFSGAGAQLLHAFGNGKGKHKGVFRPDAVRGQRAKPFLQEGLRYAFAKHGLVPR
jgi:hypothetical protein